MAKKQTKRTSGNNGSARKRSIDDGKITFQFNSGSGNTTCQLDLLTAKLASEELEEKHQLEQREYRPTAAFLTDLAEQFSSLGAKGCTPTMAYQMWNEVTARMLELKKNMNA